MDLTSYTSANATNNPTSPRPSLRHIFCSEPPCWLLIEPLDPEAAALPSAPHGATS